ncbi:MAG: hypothetical protein ABIH59_02545 [archaeon]
MKNKMLMKKRLGFRIGGRGIRVLVSFMLITLVLISLQSVSAIGITPGRTSINFEPGLHKEVSFSIINSEKKDMSVVFVVRGNLSESVTLSQTYTEILSSEESKSFTYSIDLPQGVDKPGKYEIEIVALEMPKDIEQIGAFVGATVAVITQLHVYVPYPDKYVEAEVNVIKSEGKINFVVPAINRGKLDVVSAKTVIDIYTALNAKVASLETNEISLNSLERREMFAEWIPNVGPGKYLAVATVIYDNEVAKVERQFEVGEMLLEILEINVRDFELGEIAKFNALVENKWSSDFKEVYLNILVYNNEGEIMADFKSPTYDLNALSKSEMVAYWDTAGVHKGTYDGKLLLKYGEKSTERNIQMKIGENSLEVVGLTGHVLVKGKGTGLNINNILIIVVAVLVVANIAWFVIIRKLLKRRKKQ